MTIGTISLDEKDQVKINGIIRRLIEQANAAGQIAGTTTNDNATAGNVGEYINSEVLSGAAISLTTNTAANITSISLTAGDWDVSLNGVFLINAATVISTGHVSISTVSATVGFPPFDRVGFLSLPAAGFTGAGNSGSVSCVVPCARVSLASTTTIYAVALAIFTTNTCAAYGKLTARRVR